MQFTKNFPIGDGFSGEEDTVIRLFVQIRVEQGFACRNRECVTVLDIDLKVIVGILVRIRGRHHLQTEKVEPPHALSGKLPCPFINGSLAQEEFGELDFTDGGIEGALGFRVSRKAVKALANGASVTVRIDLKPALDENQLEKKLGNVGMLDGSKSHTVSSIPVSILSSLIPTSIAKAFAATNKANIKRYGLAASLKKWDFAIEGYTGYERAVITAGGISDDEVNPKTMESKLVPGLYFAGEILDIDGDTGGYNLQIAWSTGHAAGLAAELAAGK